MSDAASEKLIAILGSGPGIGVTLRFSELRTYRTDITQCRTLKGRRGDDEGGLGEEGSAGQSLRGRCAGTGEDIGAGST